jgi:ComEC/Rec2-related protein
MRYAGISHILCVSGLHLSLVAAIFFMTSRVLLNLSSTLALRCDIKKLAGYISLLASFFYLLLTGMQIAATRAFIMTSVAIYSILIARQPYPMRSLSLACVVILTMNPEYAIHPSFQLSFIAVISLLVGYEFYSNAKNILGHSKGIFASLKLYMFSNIYSSIVASLATAPIVIYHFYVYSNYSILANLVAVPMVSFVSMPAGIIALAFSFTGYTGFLFNILGKSIDIIRDTASFTVSLPKAIIYCGSMYSSTIILFIICFFWFSIWKSKLRHLGMLGMLLSMAIFLNEKHPDILINSESNFVAHNTGSEVIMYGKKISPFTQNFVANWFGYEKPKLSKVDLKNSVITVDDLYIDFENNSFKLNNADYPIKNLVTKYSKEGLVEYHSSNRFMFR